MQKSEKDDLDITMIFKMKLKIDGGNALCGKDPTKNNDSRTWLSNTKIQSKYHIS